MEQDKLLPRLGEIIYWDFKQKTWELEVLNEIAEVVNIDIRFQPMRFSDILKQAIATSNYEGYDIIVRNTGNKYFIGIVGIKDDITIKHSIVIETKNEVITQWKAPDLIKDLSTTIRNNINSWYKKIDAVYLSNKILKFINLISVRLRDRGGVYFIPQKFVPQIDKLEDFLTEIQGVKFNRIGLIDETRTRNEIYSIMINETNELIKGINDYIKETKQEKKRLRTDGYNTRIQELTNMRIRLQNILASINISMENLKKELDEVENNLISFKLEYNGENEFLKEEQK